MIPDYNDENPPPPISEPPAVIKGLIYTFVAILLLAVFFMILSFILGVGVSFLRWGGLV